MPANEEELSTTGQIIAGILIIGCMLASLFALVALWPDKMPPPKSQATPLYAMDLLNVRLDTIVTNQSGQKVYSSAVYYPLQQTPSKHLHINTLLIILIALGGFVGNLIYLSSTFAVYVATKRFLRSWLLWYFVKPFTSAGLALAIYFLFRGGLLNFSDDTANINLYGLMSVAVLVGLFTDRAMLKLKEVFGVLLNVKDKGPDNAPAKNNHTANSKTQAVQSN